MSIDAHLSTPAETLRPMKGESLFGWYYRLEHAPISTLQLPRFEVVQTDNQGLSVRNFHQAADEVIGATGIQRGKLKGLLDTAITAFEPYIPWATQSAVSSSEPLILPNRDLRVCETCLANDHLMGRFPTIRPEHCTPLAVYCSKHGTALMPVDLLRPQFFKVSDYHYHRGYGASIQRYSGAAYPTAPNQPMARSVSDAFLVSCELDPHGPFGWAGAVKELREAIFAVLYLLSKRRYQLNSNIGNGLLLNHPLKWAFPTLAAFDCQAFQNLDVHRKAVCLNFVGQFLASGSKSVPMDLLGLLDQNFARFIDRERQIPEVMRTNLLILLVDEVSPMSTDCDQEEIAELFPAFAVRWSDAIDYLDSKRTKRRQK